ncbi:MAG: polysaccharide biosynthesis C-terminal domain-containing protein [Xanthobacteraceae bacterium]|nr:polysaccharide biosynthesis C-terminal domain-containing protein [Xanthobacteraceae bacterium]
MAVGGYGQIVMVLALEALLIAIGMPVVTALSAMECARANFWIGLIGTVITATLVAWLVFQWGLLGAACGVLAGSLAWLAARWRVFLTLAHRAYQTSACASRVAAV